MRLRSIVPSVAALVFAVVPVARAEDARVITGLQHLASGPASCAADNKPLRLLLGNGIISSMTGNCKGPVKADGTFDGVCNLTGETLHFSGKAVATTVSLHTEHVFPNFTCVYDTKLIPE